MSKFPKSPTENFFRGESSGSLLSLWKDADTSNLQFGLFDNKDTDETAASAPTKNITNTLLLIDCQKDFHPGGSLAIPTAHEDAARIATIITEQGSKLQRIICTLDSHHPMHIAHPEFWLDANGAHPLPFTVISTADIEAGTWKPRTDLDLAGFIIDDRIFEGADAVMKTNTDNSNNKKKQQQVDITKYVLEYTKRLEARGRFQLCIWPPHCLMGSTGHGIVDIIQDALVDWSRTTGRTVEYVLKGHHLLTEMYSVLSADVPVSVDTAMNENLVSSLLGDHSDCLLVAGQAMSHCVNYTVRDLVDAVAPTPESISKIHLLTDCASAVPGFEAAASQFQVDMKEKGVTLLTSKDVSLEQ